MKQLTIKYFALFRESTGQDQEQVQSSARTAAELFEELRERHPGLKPFEHMKLAINDELVQWDSRIEDGDVVLLFPPVAGG